MRARVELPRARWPLADRMAWDEMFREGDLLDGRGAAVHWSEATRRTNAKHYARWLGWLAANGLLEADLAPLERAAPERVQAYARSLIDRLAPRTTASALIGLKCVLQRKYPEGDWRWLKDLTNRLDRWAKPVRASPGKGLAAADLFARTLAELEERACGPLEKRRAQLLYRDTLIVALLIACPLRLRNLAMMRIDDHLSRIGQEWHVQFDGSDTKTGQPIHLVLTSELDHHIAAYLDRVWPVFRRAPGDMHLWPGNKGRVMAEITIYNAVVARTRELFGMAINPHAFRSLAATLLAESSPEDALHARPLLGHRQQDTTERYYVRASQLAAARNISAALRTVRDA